MGEPLRSTFSSRFCATALHVAYISAILEECFFLAFRIWRGTFSEVVIIVIRTLKGSLLHAPFLMSVFSSLACLFIRLLTQHSKINHLFHFYSTFSAVNNFFSDEKFRDHTMHGAFYPRTMKVRD